MQEKACVERSLERAEGRAEAAKSALVEYKESRLAAETDREEALRRLLQDTTQELHEVHLHHHPHQHMVLARNFLLEPCTGSTVILVSIDTIAACPPVCLTNLEATETAVYAGRPHHSSICTRSSPKSHD